MSDIPQPLSLFDLSASMLVEWDRDIAEHIKGEFEIYEGRRARRRPEIEYDDKGEYVYDFDFVVWVPSYSAYNCGDLGARCYVHLFENPKCWVLDSEYTGHLSIWKREPGSRNRGEQVKLDE